MASTGRDREPKLSLLPGPSPSQVTFLLEQEDHTMGNALRYSRLRDPAVTFCGYSMPHPSEQRIHIRVQTRAGGDAVAAFRGGCESLVEALDVMEAEFVAAVARGPEPAAGAGTGKAVGKVTAAGGAAKAPKKGKK